MKALQCIVRALRPYRLPEALLVSGFIFIGSFFAVPDMAALIGVRPLLFLGAAYLVMIAIYAFNSWAGSREDRLNPRLTVATGMRYPVIAAVTLFAAFLLFLSVEPRALPYALGVFLLSALYSYPRRGTKYVPVAGTVTHIFGGIAQFLLGWMIVSIPDMRSAAIALYFGIILSAGHVNHELIDRDADHANGIRSGAVVFGVHRWVIFHLALTLVALLLMLSLGYLRLLPAVQIAPFIAASIIQTVSAFILFFRPPTQRSFLRHRLIYRLCYALAGVVFFAIKFGGPTLS
ncbi:MAG TPA: UbiA family prenyltransferase [bacterium]|nr:UbiA family prenyltransferase [bacterium]